MCILNPIENRQSKIENAASLCSQIGVQFVQPEAPSLPVLIQFNCYPFRSATRLDIPMDAPEEFQELCRRFVQALRQHGTEHTYYLHNATVEFQLSNRPGANVKFRFEGTIWTNTEDRKTARLEITTEFLHSDFGPLDPAVQSFFDQAIHRAVTAEFDRYIEAGELEKTVQQAKEAILQADQTGGYMGMGI